MQSVVLYQNKRVVLYMYTPGVRLSPLNTSGYSHHLMSSGILSFVYVDTL